MALNIQKVQHLIFDLDDTLFDTFGLLVQPAIEEACQAMIKVGLDTSLEKSKKKYSEEFMLDPRQNIYEKIVTHFGVRAEASSEQVAQAGVKAFYGREIKEAIKTFEGVNETLERLGRVFKLSLVTFGTPKTQKKKMELLKIENYFSSISFVDVAIEESKKIAFEKIMASSPDLEPSGFVSIGNRIDGEIRSGKELGMQTLLMLHGEYLHLKPRDQFEIPDGQIKKIPDLLEIFKARLQ